MAKIKVAPSLLSADFAIMAEELKTMEQAGADILHYDVMDGVFVPNISLGIKMLADIHKRTNLPLDCHLMIVEPWKYVEKFVQAGASYVTVHYEACQDRLAEVLQQIKDAGAKAGVVINPDTPTCVLQSIVKECDIIVLMSVYPGFGGQKYIPSVTQKIQEVATMVKESGREIEIEVDGGITLENAQMVKDAGATILVAGNTVFSAKDRKYAVESIRGVE